MKNIAFVPLFGVMLRPLSSRKIPHPASDQSTGQKRSDARSFALMSTREPPRPSITATGRATTVDFRGTDLMPTSAGTPGLTAR